MIQRTANEPSRRVVPTRLLWKLMKRNEREQRNEETLYLPIECSAYLALDRVAARDFQMLYRACIPHGRDYGDVWERFVDEILGLPGLVLAAHLGEGYLRHYLFHLAGNFMADSSRQRFTDLMLEFFERRHSLPLPLDEEELNAIAAEFGRTNPLPRRRE